MKNPGLTAALICACLLAAACSKGQTGGGGAPASGAAANAAAQAGPQAAESDVEFARAAFRRLAAGDASVEAAIDWENLRALGEDYGAEYRAVPDDQKAAERKDFIEGFAEAFAEEGGDAEKLVNWREESRGRDGTLVAAEMPNGATFLLTVAPRDGQPKITALGVRERR